MRKVVVNEKMAFSFWRKFDNANLSGGSGQLGGVFSLNAIESSSHVCSPFIGDKEMFWC